MSKKSYRQCLLETYNGYPINSTLFVSAAAAGIFMVVFAVWYVRVPTMTTLSGFLIACLLTALLGGRAMMRLGLARRLYVEQN